MVRQKKIAIWSAFVLGTAACLLAAVFFLAPAYLNTAHMKAKMRSSLSSALRGEVNYARLEVALFPRPHLVVRELDLSTRSATGNIKSVNVYPQIIPLLTRQVRLTRVLLQEPDLSIHLPEKKGPKDIDAEAGPLEELEEIKPAISRLETIGPGLEFQIEQGKFILARGNRAFLSVRRLNAIFIGPPGEMTISLMAKADAFGELSLNAVFLDGAETTVKNLSMSVGRSSLSEVSAGISRSKPRTLSIKSGKGSLALDQLFGWFSSLPAVQPHIKGVASLKGTLSFSSLNLDGPLLQPASWKIAAIGKAESVVLDAAFIPSPAFLSGFFSVKEKTIEVTNVSALMGKSSASGVSGRFSSGDMGSYRIFSGQADLDLQELYAWRSRFNVLEKAFKNVKALRGKMALTSVKASMAADRSWWRVETQGSVQGVTIESPLLPGPTAVTRADFAIVQGDLLFRDLYAATLDSSLIFSGSIHNFQKEPDRAELFMNGTLGRDGMKWIFTKFALPEELIIKPLSLFDSHLQWDKASGLTLAARAHIDAGPDISIDAARRADGLVIRRASIKDHDSDAVASYAARDTTISVSFSGALAEATIMKLFERSPRSGNGRVEGDFRAAVHTDDPQKSSITGKLSGYDFVFPTRLPVPLLIDRFSLQADAGIIRIHSASATWGSSHFSFDGEVTASRQGFVVDIDVENDKLNISEMLAALKPEDREPEQSKGEKSSGGEPAGKTGIGGMIEIDSSSLTFGRFPFSPFKAIVTFGPAGVSAAITEAQVCGVSAPGTFSIFKGILELELTPAISREPLAYSISCLTGLDLHITGTYDLNADIRGQGKGSVQLSTLEGNVDFTARNGKIYRYPALTKIFSVLSVTEIFRGKTPVLGGSGFPYKKMVLKGNMHQGKLRLEQAYMTGSSVDIIAEGNVDFSRRRMDLVVLVAPFSTLNYIIRHIPLIGKLMGGTLVSIPVKVTGDFENPDVTFLDPSVVGSRIVNLFKNIVELPVEIISPFFERERKEGKD